MALGNWLYGKLSEFLTTELDEEKRGYLCDFDRICHEIIPGDVLLVEGHNRISRAIKRVTLSCWTHASLYIGRIHSIEDPRLREMVRQNYHGSAGQQLVIDSLMGKGTLIHPLTRYKNYHIRICRPTGISHRDAQKVIGFAIRHLGRTYDTRHILDLARFLLATRWFIPSQWKSSLFMNPPTQASKDICSSMIAEAFVSVNFPVLPLIRPTAENSLEMIHRNPRLYIPSDFDYSPYFSIIKYPIYPYQEEGPYHHLPWRQDLVSHDVYVEPKNTPEKEKT